LHPKKNKKLAYKYHRPLKIQARIGKVAYRLELHDKAKIYPPHLPSFSYEKMNRQGPAARTQATAFWFGREEGIVGANIGARSERTSL
jgi:hypothetical protein